MKSISTLGTAPTLLQMLGLHVPEMADIAENAGLRIVVSVRIGQQLVTDGFSQSLELLDGEFLTLHTEGFHRSDRGS